jgi:hypothetical protein
LPQKKGPGRHVERFLDAPTDLWAARGLVSSDELVDELSGAAGVAGQSRLSEVAVLHVGDEEILVSQLHPAAPGCGSAVLSHLEALLSGCQP